MKKSILFKKSIFLLVGITISLSACNTNEISDYEESTTRGIGDWDIAPSIKGYDIIPLNTNSIFTLTEYTESIYEFMDWATSNVVNKTDKSVTVNYPRTGTFTIQAIFRDTRNNSIKTVTKSVKVLNPPTLVAMENPSGGYKTGEWYPFYLENMPEELNAVPFRINSKILNFSVNYRQPYPIPFYEIKFNNTGNIIPISASSSATPTMQSFETNKITVKVIQGEEQRKIVWDQYPKVGETVTFSLKGLDIIFDESIFPPGMYNRPVFLKHKIIWMVRSAYGYVMGEYHQIGPNYDFKYNIRKDEPFQVAAWCQFEWEGNQFRHVGTFSTEGFIPIKADDFF